MSSPDKSVFRVAILFLKKVFWLIGHLTSCLGQLAMPDEKTWTSIIGSVTGADLNIVLNSSPRQRSGNRWCARYVGAVQDDSRDTL